MLVNGILTAAGLAMIVPMCVPSRWRARKTGESGAGEFIPGLGEDAVAPAPATSVDPTSVDPTSVDPTFVDQPASFRPIRAEVLAPLPTAPWSAADGEVNLPAGERR